MSEQWIKDLHNDHKRARATIERLKEQKRRKDNVITQQGLCIDEQWARIKELEKPITISRHELLGKEIIQLETGAMATPWVSDNAEIKRLREETTFLAGQLGEQEDDKTALRERIEELEKQIKDEEPWVLNGHIITTDQIRAAWREANATTHLKYQNVTLLRFLERHFNIVRCEGCGGGGRYYTNDECVSCHDCNGEGWVVKDVGGENEKKGKDNE